MKTSCISFALVILAVAAFVNQPAASTPCASLINSNYSEIEALLLTDRNLIALEKAFFPTNVHSSITINVTYHFINSQMDQSVSDGLELNAGASYHHLRPQIAEKGTNNEDIDRGFIADNTSFEDIEFLVVQFRWLASSINLFIRPDLLKSLSLLTYQAPVVLVDIYLEVSCSIEGFSYHYKNVNSTCEGAPSLLKQLNEITTNVSLSKRYVRKHY